MQLHPPLYDPQTVEDMLQPSATGLSDFFLSLSFGDVERHTHGIDCYCRQSLVTKHYYTIYF